MAAKKRARTHLFKTETIRLAKGLTRKEAIRRCMGRWKYDHRGFSYDPRTGIATAT